MLRVLFFMASEAQSDYSEDPCPCPIVALVWLASLNNAFLATQASGRSFTAQCLPEFPAA